MMRSISYNPRLIALNILVVVLGGVGVYQAYQKAGPLIDVKTVAGHAVIGGFMARTPDALRQHARIGDTIVAVDGLQVYNAGALETMFDARAVGDYVTLEIRRSTATYSVAVQLARVYSPLYMSLVILVGTLFFSLGVLVLWKRPDDAASMIFYLAMNCSTIMIMATAGRFSIDPNGLGHIVRIAYLTGYAFMTVLFFHFTLIFPASKWPHVRRSMRWVYGCAAVLAVVTSTTFLLTTTVSMVRWVDTFSQAFEICQIFFAAVGIASVASFVHSYRSSVEETERLKLRWVLTGVTVGFLTFIVLSLIPTSVLGIAPLVDEEWIILMIGVAPITFAIAIVRHRVMDIDLILSRSSVYMIVIGALVLVYTALVTFFGQIVVRLGWSDVVGSTVATLVSALLFAPARQRVQRFVDQRFFRTRYNLRQAQRTLAEKLNACAESTSLIETATQILDGILAPERIAFATVRSGDGAVTLITNIAVVQTDRVPDVHSISEPIVPGVIYADERWIEPGVEHSSETHSLIKQLEASCAIAASFNDNDMVVLLVGPKKSGTRYALEDLDVLRAAITHTSNGMERIMLQTNIVRREAEAVHLRELDRMKSYFVSSVTHELKTPLTSIRMFAEMLQSERVHEQHNVSRYAKIIEAESQRLTRLIDNVLDFSKIERGAKEYRFADIALTDIVDGVVESLEHQITGSGFVLDRVDDAGPIALSADADAVAGAIVNLISNAIKYSPAERAIGVRTFRRNNFAGVSVADRGIGLSEEDRAHIFDPFYRAEAGKRIGATGTGLGLALVGHVVDAHGGTIEVESMPGRGSTFTLLFPINDSENNSIDRG